LNLLSVREPGIYGSHSFEEYLLHLVALYPAIEFSYFQSNVEGEIINKLHETGFSYNGIILNASAYTHTSIAIGDAVKSIPTPVIEVHISNIYAREPFRHQSMLAGACKGVISGFGLDSYRLAIEALKIC
jgi:3-dehydroquinate dehydratase-2